MVCILSDPQFPFRFGTDDPQRSGCCQINRSRKQTPASQLESVLPQMAFEKWLRVQVGPDAAIGWVVRTGDGHGLPWVEADVSIQGRPGIAIMIAAGTPKPTFRSLGLVRADDFAEWRRLRDLPEAMRKARAE